MNTDHHGLLCRLTHTVHNETITESLNENDTKDDVKTNSEGNTTPDNAISSSIEYLNLCVDKSAKKTDSFFHLFSKDNGCLHKKKSVIIVEPNGHKAYPTKPNKKDKSKDGSKTIIQSDPSATWIDLSSSGLKSLSKSLVKLTQLTELVISCNKISKLPREIGQLVNLKILLAQENNMDYLPSEIKLCKNLSYLDIRHNHLANDCLAVLQNLVSLKTLLLTHNKLTRLDGIGNLKKLESLTVKGNKLEGKLTKSIGKLVQLSALDLSKNQISRIPAEIGLCISLRRLGLEYNKLKDLPVTLGNLHNIESLGLRYNQLSSIPIELSRCVKLTELNVESNLVHLLPNTLYLNLNNATKLNISHNYFQRLPTDEGAQSQYSKTEKLYGEYNEIETLDGVLRDAKQLRVLNLACNRLCRLSVTDIRHLESLVELNLSFNLLTNIPVGFECLTKLEVLDLTNNELETLPKHFGYLPRLTSLNVESNQITHLPIEFGNLPSLKSLNISSNRITEIPEAIWLLKKLQILNLSENSISKIPESIGRLSCLTHLFLKDNKSLNILPISLVDLENLTFLSLKGCPLKNIPVTYAGSPVLVMTYLRALDVGLKLKEAMKHHESQHHNTKVKNNASNCDEDHSDILNDEEFMNELSEEVINKMQTTAAGFLACACTHSDESSAQIDKGDESVGAQI